MITSAPVSVLDFIPESHRAAIATYGSTVALDTYIQPVLDTYDNVYFPPGYYAVNGLVTTRASQTITWDLGAYMVGVATTATNAIMRFRKIQGRYINLNIVGAFNTNYIAAMQVDAISASGGDYPGRCRWTNLTIANIAIGVLYGSVTSPVDAPVSENNIIGGEFRDVERCFFINQPNGFLYVTGMLVDCQLYSGHGTFAVSAAVEQINGWIQFTNCQLIKAQSTEGFLIINAGVVTLTGCHGEVACVNFLGRGNGRFYIDGWRNSFFSNATTEFIALEAGSSGIFKATNLIYKRPPNSEFAGVGLVKNYSGANWDLSFVNGVFENQQIESLLNSPNSNSVQSRVNFISCLTEDNTYGQVGLETVQTSKLPKLLDLPTGGVIPPVANYTCVVGGTSILVLTDPGPTFDQCINMISGAAVNQLQLQPSTGYVLPYSGSSGVIEWYQKVVADGKFFNGSLILYYQDAVGNVTPRTLQSGSVGNIAVNNTSTVDWVRCEAILPALLPKTTLLGIEFRQSVNAQNWRIGGIRIF